MGLEPDARPGGYRFGDDGQLMPLALFALALGTFGIGTTELVIMGLLPEVSADLGVSIPKVGLLVTGYALGVAIGGPILVILTNRLSQKTALLVLMGVFVVGNVLCAVAPFYGFLMVARIVASFCHGAFVGIASVVAADIVPHNRRASAVTLVWAGFSAANIIGVPAGTALGQALGWRSTFWAVAALGFVAAAMIAVGLPGKSRAGRSDLTQEFKVLGRWQMLLAFSMSALFCAAGFGVYTYIAPILLNVTGIAAGGVPGVLFAFGIGGTIGMLLGGRLADWKLMPVIIGVFATLVVVYLVLLIAIHRPVAAVTTIVIWGFFFYAPAGALQIRIVNMATEAPNLASTLNQSAFNLGIAIGPFISAAALSAGLAYASLPWVGAVLALIGFGVALFSLTLERQPRDRP